MRNRGRPCRQMQSARPGGTDADHGNMATDAQCREDLLQSGIGRSRLRPRRIALHVFKPPGERLLPGRFDILVMIAGNDGDLVGGTHDLQPIPGEGKFRRQAEMGQIAGYDNVVRPCPLQIFTKSGKKPIVLVVPPLQLPPQAAEQPFVEKITDDALPDAGDVRVGAMGNHIPCRRGRSVRQGHKRPAGVERSWRGRRHNGHSYTGRRIFLQSLTFCSSPTGCGPPPAVGREEAHGSNIRHTLAC